MVMTKEHYNKLETTLKARLDNMTKEDLQRLVRSYQANPRFKDWRIAFMWAMYHMVKPLDRTEAKDYLDAHIETALKRAIGSYIYPRA